MEAGAPHPRAPLVEFTVAGQRCLLELTFVCEVRRLGALTPLPLPRAGVLGIVHLRGRMLPVFDGAVVLGALARERVEGGDLLVMGREQALFAFAGLAVCGLREDRPAPADDAPLFLDGEHLLAEHALAGG